MSKILCFWTVKIFFRGENSGLLKWGLIFMASSKINKRFSQQEKVDFHHAFNEENIRYRKRYKHSLKNQMQLKRGTHNMRKAYFDSDSLWNCMIMCVYCHNHLQSSVQNSWGGSISYVIFWHCFSLFNRLPVAILLHMSYPPHAILTSKSWKPSKHFYFPVNDCYSLWALCKIFHL